MMTALPLTQRNLSEQMKITDREIEERKRLLHFTDSDAAVLKSYKEMVAKKLEDIVARFYYQQQQIPEVELLIGDRETFRRLHQSMKNYIMELFGGYYDREYVDKRLRIGKVHKRIGVEPKLYISAVGILQEILDQELRGGLSNTSEEVCAQCNDLRLALHRLLLFDIQLVFDTYISSLISEVDAAKSQVERYAESLEGVVAERTQQLEKLSSTDELTQLLNQRTFFSVLRREIARAEQNRHPVCLVYFDLNGFKKLNDSQGHSAGDNLLALVGHNAANAIRSFDTAFRYGGDEFCIVLPETELATAVKICQRMANAFDQQDTKKVTFSIGIAQIGPQQFTDVDSFVRQADSLMYEAKAASKKKTGHYIRYDDKMMDPEEVAQEEAASNP
ncbi:GGDEF domain-containing protein [Magnetofaba australis]|uniref:Diguanylate cyclase DosC n=1 Tax=Magnetofaba australis IT-1 TaxID=1434232 RepID=A0A1Y2K871_9PROT|nr:GGDEF domain-containing protein [Magnetofaba australis]OSM06872.1 putative GGDEF domain protein [Magnetofaba australis IT-1]